MVVAGLGEPPPVPTTQLIALPPTPLPLSSTRRTTRESASCAPTAPVCVLPDTRTSEVGFAGSAVCVKVTEASPTEEACAVCGPEALPSTRSAAAVPSAPLDTLAGLMDPPPTTAHCTSTPATGLPRSSVTRTTSESARAEPTAATWLLPLTSSSSAPTPETAEALKFTSRSSPLTWALTRCWPAVVPSVQVADAVPSSPVWTLAGDTWPPPASIAKTTACPATGRSSPSVTLTTIGLASVAPAGADCSSPSTMAIFAGRDSLGRTMPSPPQAASMVDRPNAIRDA